MKVAWFERQEWTLSGAGGVAAAKMDHLRREAGPRLPDLFSGCGGLSLRFQAAGFEVAGAVERFGQDIQLSLPDGVGW